MKFIVFLLFVCISNVFADTTEVILDYDGYVVVIRDQRQTQLAWAEMLIRGTYDESMPFDADLYSKYYSRVIQTGQKTYDTVLPAGNFRNHQSQNDIIQAFDMEKTPLRLLDIDMIFKDIFSAATISEALKKDDIEDVFQYRRWHWGTKETMQFIPLLFPDMPESRCDSIYHEPGKWFLPLACLSDSLNLKNATIRQINDDMNVSTKLKTWFSGNVVSKPGITFDTSLWDVLQQRNINKLWMRHKEFRKGLKASWLQRRKN